MRASLAVAAALLAAGLAALAYAATLGQVTVAFLLVVPVIVGTGPWGALAGLLVMAGLVLGFFAVAARLPSSRGPHGFPYEPAEPGPPRTREEERARRVAVGRPPEVEPAPARRPSGGGFVLLGPIPIAFGSTRDLARAMLLLALAVLAVLLLLPLLLGGRA